MARKRKAKNSVTKIKRKYRKRKAVVVTEFRIAYRPTLALAGEELARAAEAISARFGVTVNGNMIVREFPKEEANRRAQGYSRTIDRTAYMVGVGYSA